MERQMKKCRQMSPERARVSLEGSSNQGRVQVIYYLSRNHHLEHPHFIEVPLSSPEGLYLKDVMDRLNFVRGRGMPSMYSWSCKRSYKNGFVWHDLCGEDLILPAQGNEYILKGSELFQDSHSDLVQTSSHVMLQNTKPLKQSKMSVLDREMNPCQEEQPSLPHNCAQSSVKCRDGIDPSRSPSKRLTEYNVDKGIGRADASTQTDEIVRRARTRQRCKEAQNQGLKVKENSALCGDEISPSLSSSSTSSGPRTGTLESLMKADSSTMTSFRTLEEGNVDTSSSASNRTVDVLMQLISCGSISVNDHAFDFIPGYKPRLSNLKIPSPLHSSSEMLGELNYASEHRRPMGSRLEDKEYFSGSLIETKTNRSKDGGCNSLKRSSSYNADRTCKLVDTIAEDGGDICSTRSKCIPQSLKSSLRLRREPIRSPLSQARRNSSADVEAKHLIPLGVFNDASKRTTVTSLVKTSPQIRDSCREEEGKVTTIEERLPSGAWVIIQSKAVLDIVHV